jgi:mannose-6-phosphate isomerase-like protein (cupin superfamily)
VGDEIRTVHENTSINIPIGFRHRLANPARIALELIARDGSSGARTISCANLAAKHFDSKY